MIFAAASSSSQTFDFMIGDIAKWLRQTRTSLPFIDFYDTNTGELPSFELKARPMLGAAFAPLVAKFH
jgi:Domain of unknown function (DUF1793)